MRNQRGFTLAEIMIVMGISVIFAAAAIPFSGTQLKIARNHSREVRLSAEMSDAFLQALNQSRENHYTVTPIEIESSSEAVQDLQAFKDSANESDKLTVSGGGSNVVITADRLPNTISSIKFSFAVHSTQKTVWIDSVIVNSAVFSAA